MENAVRRALERATLEVKASNTIALSLYEKFGFQIAGRRKGYYEKTGEDALILWLSGLEKPQFSLILQKWHQEISDRLLVNNWTWEMITDN
jgi:ribosomal-protein-alanine N-acetyltransferase